MRLSISSQLLAVAVATPSSYYIADGREGSQYKELDYKRFGDLSSKHGSVDAAIEGEKRGLRMYTPDSGTSTEERCVDEYVGFRAMPKREVLSLMQSVNYEVCTKPNSEEAHPTINGYDIEPHLNCEDKDWIRLDCKVTSKSRKTPFFVSRAGRKPTASFLRLFSGGEKYFKDRIQCGKKASQHKQYEECQGLLDSFIKIEEAACGLDTESSSCSKASKGKPQAAASAINVEASDPSQEAPHGHGGVANNEAAPDEKKGAEPMSTTTIALIVGGCVLLIGGGFAAYKAMGDDGKQAGAKRRKGKKDLAERSQRNRGSDPDEKSDESLVDRERPTLRHSRPK